MTFGQKLEYLSDRKMLVIFYREDTCDLYKCNIAILGRRPVSAQAITAKKAFNAAFDRAVFKMNKVRLVAN